MSFSLELEEKIKRLVDEEFEKYMYFATKKLHNIMLAHIHGSINKFRQVYGYEPVVEIVDNSSGDTISVTVTARFSEETKEKLRKIIEKKIREERLETKLRIKALHAIIKSELKSATGGLNALLHAHSESAGKSADATRGAREEVRDQEGGHSVTRTYEGDL